MGFVTQGAISCSLLNKLIPNHPILLCHVYSCSNGKAGALKSSASRMRQGFILDRAGSCGESCSFVYPIGRSMKSAPAFISSLPLLLLALFSSRLLILIVASGPSFDEGFTITGRVKLEGKTSKEQGVPSKRTNAKVILNGGQSIAFTRADGYFSFHNVSAGTYLIEVTAVGYFFSPVRVDISARNPGKIQAALTENRRVLYELILEPLKEEQYYEIREPFSIMSLLKSPMGLMMGFMLLVIFVMPKLMENIDPEEMKRAQEEMRAQGVPSLSNLLSRGS